MTKKDFMEVIWVFVTLALIVSVGFIGGLYVSSRVIKRQQAQIDSLNQTIGEYKTNEAWFEEYVDVLEDIYEGKINEAVLEERIYWLENAKNENIPSDIYDDYVYQLLEDFDDTIEITIYYYENTDQVVDLVTYIATNYPALYARLLNYS